MRLLGVLGASFAVAFGVGQFARFSYQTDWVAGLILSAAIYLSLQIDEPYMLVVRSMPGALEQAELPEWVKKRLGDKG
jgi:hypothetical protein